MKLNKILKALPKRAQVEIIAKNAAILYKGEVAMCYLSGKTFEVGSIAPYGSRLYIYEKVGDTNAKEQVCEHQQNRHLSHEHIDC
ncbi:MAG: hypothetical protein IIY21_26490 [Clostridiales bacterium]|nr:hypothetical protein [Clostridiales bacterium]MBQ1570314.1 hypothetical protein [Clostridiales bacterium]